DLLLYAASRYGYRAGGFNLRGTDPVSYKPFDPETVVDLELGTKADWLAGDWRMRSNVAVYHQWYNNIQRTVGVTSPAGVPGSAVAAVFGQLLISKQCFDQFTADHCCHPAHTGFDSPLPATECLYARRSECELERRNAQCARHCRLCEKRDGQGVRRRRYP